MAHEEHTSRFTNSIAGGGGGGCKLSKKLKHKKVPQRGMGVAQLEKIILEERQLKDAGVLKHNSIKFRRPSIPLPPPFPPNRHRLISESDVVNADSLSNSMVRSSAIGNNWGRSYNFDGESPNSNQNQNRYLIGMPANQPGFGYVCNSSIWPQFPTQRSQFQQSCSSSMVNVPLGTTSSVMNTQIEPPSIQSFCANKYPSFMPDGEKMVELKRSYPFSMENMPIPSFNCNVSSAPPVPKSDESTSCTNGVTGATSLELTVPFCRENPSSLGSIRDQKTKKFIDENLDLTKDFLTLAPPQGQTRDASETEWANKQPLHRFFPAAKIEGASNGEVREHVDLSLKL